MPENKKKLQLFFPSEPWRELMRESARLERRPAWLLAEAWRIARKEILSYPTPIK